MTLKGYNISPSSESLFQKSKTINPANGFDPTDQFELYDNADGSVSLGLPLSAKRVWFYTYCQEKNKVGQIIPHFSIAENMVFNESMKAYEQTSNTFVPLMLITASCDVIIDNIVVAQGHAGRAVCLSNYIELNNCIQAVTGLAQSKALTNAGFGTVDSLQIDPNSGAASNGVKEPFTMGAEGELPFTMGMAEMRSGVSANSTSATQANPAAAAQSSPMSDLFAQMGGNPALAAAKATPCPLRGYYQGTPLGELKTEVLKKLVTSNPSAPSETFIEARNAAKLILDDRASFSGFKK